MNKQNLLIGEGETRKILSDQELKNLESNSNQYLRLVNENEQFKIYKFLTAREISQVDKKIKQIANKVVYISPTMEKHDIEVSCRKIQSMLLKANIKILVEARRRKKRVFYLKDLKERLLNIEKILNDFFGKSLIKIKANQYSLNKGASSSNG